MSKRRSTKEVPDPLFQRRIISILANGLAVKHSRRCIEQRTTVCSCAFAQRLELTMMVWLRSSGNKRDLSHYIRDNYTEIVQRDEA